MNLVCTGNRKTKSSTQRAVNHRKLVSTRSLLLALTIAGAMFLSGCIGVASANNGKSTNGNGSFQLSPAPISFGTVAVGKSASQTVSVSNTGKSTIHITQAALSSQQFTVSGITSPLTLPPGKSQSFKVNVIPSSTGTLSGTLTMQADGGSSPVVVALSATAVMAAPQIAVSSSSVNLGNITVGTIGSTSLTISNTGTTDLTVSMLSMAGAGFGVSGIATPKTISAGTFATMAVTFQPSAVGTVNGSLAITSNDSTNPTVNVTLSGTGTTAQVGQLSANPASYSFGNVATGSSASHAIVLTNSGTATVKISGVTATGAGFSANGLTFPVSVSPAASVSLNAVFAPTVAGSASGSLSVVSDAANSPATIVLNGTGAQAGLGVSPASFNFGSVASGQTASHAFTITNSGTSTLTISQITASGAGFSVSGLALPASVGVGGTATFTAVFAPASTGTLNGTVSIASNAVTSPTSVALSGTGTQAGLSVSPASFSFGSVVDGQTKSQGFAITNTGTSTLTIAQITASGAGYSVGGLTTPVSVAAGATTTFNAVFAPTTAGTLNGTVSIASNAVNSPATVALSGTGVAATVSMSASPTALSFGSVATGSSMTKSVTITNSGNTSLTISQVSVSAADVQASGVATPFVLNAGASTSMNVAFSPTKAETVSGNVTMTSSTGATSVVAVSGTGVQSTISVNPGSVSFGSVPVGSANSQTLIVSNSGNTALTISQISAAGSGFSVGTVALPLTVNPGATATFNAQFQPAAAGTVSGSLTLVSNAPSSPTMVALSGTGSTATQTLSFSSNSLNFGNITTGSSSLQTVTITNTGNSAAQISAIGVSGSGFGLSGANAPVTVNAGQVLTINVSFTPVVAGSVSGAVTVTSNAAGSPATITLAGNGVAPASHTVSLTWDAPGTTVNGYNVYRSTTSGSGYVKINSAVVSLAGFTDITVQNSTTYYYVTTALDASNNESGFSNEAAAIIP